MSPVNYYGLNLSQLAFGAGKKQQQPDITEHASTLNSLSQKAHMLRAKFLLSQGGEKNRDSFNHTKALLDENNITINQSRKKISGKNWQGFNLKNIIFDNAKLTNINASGSDMDGAGLANTTANHCNFDNTSIKKANARGFRASLSTFENASIGGDWSHTSLPDNIRDRINIEIQPDTNMEAVCYSHPSWRIVHEQMKNPETPTIVLALATLREKARQEALSKAKGKGVADLHTISEEELSGEEENQVDEPESSGSSVSTTKVIHSNSEASLADSTPQTSLESSIASIMPSTHRGKGSMFYLSANSPC